MIEIDDKIVSLDLLRECFACDLSRCKGICCVEGNAGAPLEIEEVATLEAQYETYKPYMTPPRASPPSSGRASWSWTTRAITPRRWSATPSAPTLHRKRRDALRRRTGLPRRTSARSASRSRATSIRSASCASRTVRWASTITAGRFAGPRWSAAAGWASLSTRALREPIVRRFGEEFYRALEAAEEFLREQER